MADFEVHIDLNGRTRQIGLARSNRVRGRESVIFGNDGDWLEDPDRFSLEPALALGRGAFALTLAQARSVIKEVASVTATWRDTAKALGVHAAEIKRMASAFEHDDLKRALAL